jgi:hypothetical protein
MDPLPQQIGDAIREHAGLSRASASDNQDGPFGGRNGIALSIIQTFKQVAGGNTIGSGYKAHGINPSTKRRALVMKKTPMAKRQSRTKRTTPKATWLPPPTLMSALPTMTCSTSANNPSDKTHRPYR